MQKNKIELEELLKLKRAESPNEADWERFDSALRGRLLKEAVSTRSSFNVFKGAFSSVFLFALFVGVASFYFYTPNTDCVSDIVGVSSSPLPDIRASYAVNEFSVNGLSADPVFVQMENVPFAVSDASSFGVDSLSVLRGASF